MPESITDWLIYVVFNVACFFAPFLALLPDYSRSDAPTPSNLTGEDVDG